MNELERAVRWEVLSSLRDTSRAPTTDALARVTGATAVEVAQALRSLADSHVLVLRPGTTDVWMAHPFSAIATDHVAQIGRQRWFANCAWDALAILALLGEGRYSTTCPASGTSLEFARSGDELIGDGAIHFLVPAKQFWDDIGFT